MSRFSPTVLPTSGRSLANALGQGVNAFLVTRAQKRQQDIEDEMRQRGEAVQNAELGQQGIHITKPGELPPTFDVNVSGGPNPDDIVSRAITPLVAQQPRRPGQAPMDEGPVPGMSGPPLAAALSRHLSMGPGYVIDRDEQAANAQRGADAKFQAMLAEALAKGKAEDLVDPYARSDKHALAQSEIAKNSRPPVVPPQRIDPLSPEGLRAQRELERYRASLRPQTTSVGPDGVPLGKPNAENLKNAAFLDIAQSEDQALKDMGATVGSSAISRIPLLGNVLLKHTDPKFQAQQLAGDRWIMQWLRSTSGAAISADELSNYRKQYIPQPGDTPETIRGKEAARADVERGLAKMAGAAAPRAPLSSRSAPPGDVNLGGDTAGVTIPAPVQTIDEMIKAGKSDAEIKAAIARGVH